ncbi:MAG: bifunctional riboflavin kinase/FAD synthetase [Fusobacterium sp.]|nr:bifunctional riboflavin kinase/FAD synthetase [Fusobacterium sp.]
MVVVDNILTSKFEFEDTFVAIGNFDGVHYGHQMLIKDAVIKAKKAKKKSVVFTFLNHPMEIIRKNKTFDYINTVEEKLYLLENLGVDYVVLQPFDKNFSEYSPLEFVQILKNKLKAKELFVGFNFSFGKDGVGKPSDLKYLAEIYGIKVNEIPPITLNNQVVSSSLIRKLILDSKFEEAVKYLGHPLNVIGEVIHGKKIARTLGYPTANIKIANRLYPPFGIYGAYVKIENEDKVLDGVVNVGLNPTLKPGELSLEVHILNFNEDIYGKKLNIQLVKYLREEKKFDSVEKLIDTIKNDVERWKEFIKNK